MKREIQDKDLTRSEAPKMNNQEVPFYYDSLASNTTKGLQWIDNLWERSNIPADNRLVTIHCKAGSVSARLFFFF